MGNLSFPTYVEYGRGKGQNFAQKNEDQELKINQEHHEINHAENTVVGHFFFELGSVVLRNTRGIWSVLFGENFDFDFDH